MSVGKQLIGVTVVAVAAVGTSTLVSPTVASAYQERASVTRVSDGDSFHIQGSPAPIRIIGIDAPEHDTCGYGVAKSALRELAGNKDVVKLSARYESSYSMGNGYKRPLRYVYSLAARRDVSLNLLQRGLVVFNNTTREHQKETRYNTAAQYASSARLGLFADASCGAAAPATLQMYVHYNADLNDSQNIPGKYVRIVNRGVTPVNLAGWRMRPSNRKFFTLPSYDLQPQQSIVVHNGSGSAYMRDGDYHVSWGVKTDIPDPRTSIFKTGAIYLQDPNQNFRLWSYWPCVVDCSSTPVLGKLNVSANPTDEYVDVTNVSGEMVDASFLVVETGASVFELPQGNVLQPGGSVRIWAQRHGNDYSLNRDSTMMPGTGGSVLLRGNDGVTVDTYRW